jgi:hypothetical protein
MIGEERCLFREEGYLVFILHGMTKGRKLLLYDSMMFVSSVYANMIELLER